MSVRDKTTRTLASLGLAASLALGGVAAADAAADLTAAGPDRTESIGCAIRFYADGPRLHRNDAHACVGATRVHVHDNGSLVVTHDRCAPVVEPRAISDETLGPRLIFGGVSGGVCDSHITFTDVKLGRALDLSDPADYRRMVGPYSNVWWGAERVTTR